MRISRQQVLREHWRDDSCHTTPEAADAAGGASDWCFECFRSEAVKHGVEHALEEVLEMGQHGGSRHGLDRITHLHGVDANVRSLRVDCHENEERYSHQSGGQDHGVLAANAREVVAKNAKRDSSNARKVDVDV